MMKKNTSIKSKLEGDEEIDAMMNMKVEGLEGFENQKGSDVETDSEDDSLYLTANGKFDVLNEYFGISALPLPPCAGNERKMKKAIKHLKKIGALISGDYDRLEKVISALKQQNENKKIGKDSE